MQKFFGFLVHCGEKLSEVCLCNMRDARIVKGFYRRVQMSRGLAATVRLDLTTVVSCVLSFRCLICLIKSSSSITTRRVSQQREGSIW